MFVEKKAERTQCSMFKLLAVASRRISSKYININVWDARSSNSVTITHKLIHILVEDSPIQPMTHGISVRK